MKNQETVRLQTWRLRIIHHAQEVTKDVAMTCRHYGIGRQSYCRWHRLFLEFGEDGLRDRSRRPKSLGIFVADNETNIKAIFEVLHSPPSEFGINRTSWKLTDIRSCLEKREVLVSKLNKERCQERRVLMEEGENRLDEQ